MRLAFVFVFQFTVFFITQLITRFVPDVPKGFALKAKREKDMIKKVFRNKQEIASEDNTTPLDNNPTNTDAQVPRGEEMTGQQDLTIEDDSFHEDLNMAL